jgi:hypothetical protein
VYTRRLCLALATTLMALAVSATGATAADGPAFGIRVADSQNPTVVTFRSAKCHHNTRIGFVGVAYDQGWQLVVKIHPFTGFHRYELVRGHFNGTFLSVVSPSDVQYASDFVPPAHEPGAGQINFSGNGNLLGGGFAAMFNENGSDALDVAGVLRCHYPKQKPKR